MSFRGTEFTPTANLNDFRTNLNLIPTALASNEDDSDVKGATVHRGFQHAWVSIQKEIESVVKLSSTMATWKTPWTVTFVGHSLGGALATVAAVTHNLNGKGEKCVH